VLAAGLAAYPAASTEGLSRLVAVGAIAGMGLLLPALAGAVSTLPWALAALGGEYAAWWAVRGGDIDTRAPVYAAGLLVVAELVYWARDRQSTAVPAPGLEVRRFFGVLLSAVAALAIGALVLGISSISVGGGVGVEALGVAGAVALIILLAALIRADRDEQPEI
jgi:hypothetical protein